MRKNLIKELSFKNKCFLSHPPIKCHNIHFHNLNGQLQNNMICSIHNKQHVYVAIAENFYVIEIADGIEIFSPWWYEIVKERKLYNCTNFAKDCWSDVEIECNQFCRSCWALTHCKLCVSSECQIVQVFHNFWTLWAPGEAKDTQLQQLRVL